MSATPRLPVDGFGATDAWLMFLLWMAAEGHVGAALIALVILTLYIFCLNEKQDRRSLPSPSATPQDQGGER